MPYALLLPKGAFTALSFRNETFLLFSRERQPKAWLLFVLGRNGIRQFCCRVKGSLFGTVLCSQEFICRHLMDETNHRLLPMRLEESTGKILIMVPSEYNFSDQADEVQLEKEEPRLKVVAKKLQYGFGFGRKAAAAAEVRRASEKPTSMPSGLALNKSSTMLTRSGTNLNKLSLPPRDQSLSAGSFTPRSPTARGLQKDKWIDLSTFCNTAEPHIVAYLERSLSLLWNLCVGNNKVHTGQGGAREAGCGRSGRAVHGKTRRPCLRWYGRAGQRTVGPTLAGAMDTRR